MKHLIYNKHHNTSEINIFYYLFTILITKEMI